MKQMNNNSKIVKKFQPIWAQFRTHHQTEDYSLRTVFDIYLPFWKCKQSIVVEKEIELDRFSKIILQLVDQGITSHEAICAFLGIKEDSFPTIQFHFLLKLDLICEPEIGAYEITHNGIKFLQDKVKPKKTEQVDFEYFLVEKMHYLQNELTQDFFDPNLPIDQELSEQLKKNFEGYKVLQTHKMNKNDQEARQIPHDNKNKPAFKKIVTHRNDFSSFFNDQYKAGTFYDFADTKVDAHKRNIRFIGLLYEHATTEEQLLDIRQSRNSIHASGKEKYILEKTLSKKATQYIQKKELKPL